MNYAVSEYDDSIHDISNTAGFENSPRRTNNSLPTDPSKPAASPTHPNELSNGEESSYHPNEPSDGEESSYHPNELSNEEESLYDPTEPSDGEESLIVNEPPHPEPLASPSKALSPSKRSHPPAILPISDDSQINAVAVQENPDSDSLNATFPSLETQPIATKPQNTSKYFDEASQQATEGLAIPFTQPSCMPLSEKLKRRPELSSSQLKSLGFKVDIENVLECRTSRSRRSGKVDGSRYWFR